MSKFLDKIGLSYFYEKLKEYIDRKTIPSGGKTGQVLIKRSDMDYDVYWGDIEGCTVSPSEKPDDAKIYGVEWDGSARTDWTRTDDAAGFDDPDPFVNDGQHPGYSPFDNIMPWTGMTIEERAGGTMVKIPKFYYNLEQLDNNDLKIQISMVKHDGFCTSPAHMDRGDGRGERDVVYVGRYHCDYDYKSSNQVTSTASIPGAPIGSITRATAREEIHKLGNYIWQMDFVTRFTIWLLYLVEIADWNSQAKIGYGCTAGAMGYTDTMPYHTGTIMSSRDSYGGTQYRNIEGLWDKSLDFLDGCYYNSNGFNIILNPIEFNDNGEHGLSFGVLSSGYPSKFSVNTVSGISLFVPIESSPKSDAQSYTCDRWNASASYIAIYCGGYGNNHQDLGLFYLTGEHANYTFGSLGSRIMELL